jgi:prepilin-type N-terminal cleavage/methylation domain-containing protein
MTHSTDKKIKAKNSLGFTLVELIVTVGVFAVVTSITLANYPKFNSLTALTGLAQQIAIAVREAQVYGVAVKNSSSTASVVTQNIYPAYGIFFALDSANTTYGRSSAYSVFYDTVTGQGPAPYFRPIGDNIFTAEVELVETTRINNGSSIIAICGVESGSSICTPATSANIVFRRPNPDANIVVVTSNTTWPYSSPTLLNCSRVDISIQSKDGAHTKVIQVYSSGQINVQ